MIDIFFHETVFLEKKVIDRFSLVFRKSVNFNVNPLKFLIFKVHTYSVSFSFQDEHTQFQYFH
jgi:hypothetical protein